MHVYGIIDVYRTRAVHDVCGTVGLRGATRGSGVQLGGLGAQLGGLGVQLGGLGVQLGGLGVQLGGLGVYTKWYVSVAILDRSRMILTCK